MRDVQRNKLAESARSEHREQNGVAGAVAVENFLRRDEGDVGGGHARCLEFGPES